MSDTTTEDSSSSSLTSLKLFAFFIVLLCGMAGPASPVLFARHFAKKAKGNNKNSDQDQKQQQHEIKRAIKLMTCLAIGIVIATALVHMLHDGSALILQSSTDAESSQQQQEVVIKYIVIDNSSGNVSPASLTTTVAPSSSSSSNTTTTTYLTSQYHYPYGMVCALLGIVVVYIFSTELNWYGMNKLKKLKETLRDKEKEKREGAIIKLYILEVSIAVHSVIIGATLGLTPNYNTAITLTTVLCIHQFFEGLAIGSLCIQAQASPKRALGFIFGFAITTPIGILVGLRASGDSDKLTQGVLSCISAGFLLEMALTEMLGSVFEGSGSSSHAHSHGEDAFDNINTTTTTVDGEKNKTTTTSDETTKKESQSKENVDVDDSQNIELMKKKQEENMSSPKTDEAQQQQQVAEIITHEVTELHRQNLDIADDNSNNKKSTTTTGKNETIINDDESLEFRIKCYGCMILGMIIQSILGIWA